MNKLLLTEDNLRKWYLDERKTKLEIISILNCSNATLTRYLNKFGIKSRTRFEIKNKDLTNQRFGKLQVIRRDKSDNQKKSKYYCECECGGCIVTNASSLTRGFTNSCGCLRRILDYKCIPHRYFEKLRIGALKRNITFSISKEDIYNQFIKQNKKCAYTGIELKFIAYDKHNHTASVDRIDNNKDYSVNNIQIVHKTINYIKSCLSHEVFLLICNLISKENPRQITDTEIEIINYSSIHNSRKINEKHSPMSGL